MSANVQNAGTQKTNSMRNGNDDGESRTNSPHIGRDTRREDDMKKFWKTKRFWVTFMSVVAAVVSGVIDDQQLREGILAAVTAAMVYVAGLFGVEIKRTGPQ